MKISFKNDYSEGCHPRILEALAASNSSQQDGYGADDYSAKAQQLIRDKAKAPYSAIHFVSGGTQANLVTVSAFLRPHESIISARTGHIFDNETGAIEATGHKVHSIDGVDGKLTPQLVQKVLDEHPIQPHQLKQKMVYISQSTELGTIYSKDELQKLWDFCQNNSLYLYMDGARLGHALTSSISDLSLEDIARYTDAFYIGGTKNGALLGEAIVITTSHLQEDFEYYLKQKGAMLSKGRVLGIQFQELFTNDLYFEIARYANTQAVKIETALKATGCKWWAKTCTNQIFPILENRKIEKLQEKFDFYIWRQIDADHSAIRLITSWATRQEDVDSLISEISQL